MGENMLKTSEYNFIWPLEGGDSAVIYNSFTGAAIEVKSRRLDFLKDNSEIDLDLLSEEQKNIGIELAKNGFLIEDYINEKKILKYRNAKEKYSKETLALTILPTYKCNLKCFYCYQDRTKAEFMTPQVQEGILQFVLKNMKEVKKLHICWFGGEPLMAWDIICSLSERFMKIAEENGCKYSANMITNGFLFDDSKISKLKELKINVVQITLDGPPSLHTLRKGIKGDPVENFNKILDIIKKITQAKVQVKIRINIDKANMEYIDELLDILAKCNYDNVKIYPARLEAYTKICSNIESGCIMRDEFADLEARFYKSLLEKGLKSDLSCALPVLRGNYCIADQINAFSIDPNGYVYKCWNTIGNKEEMVADVMDRALEEKDKKKMIMKQIEGVTWDPFEKSQCTECKLLPVCMGGCPYRYKILNNGNPDCMLVKDNVKEIVMNHFYSIKIKNLFKDSLQAPVIL